MKLDVAFNEVEKRYELVLTTKKDGQYFASATYLMEDSLQDKNYMIHFLQEYPMKVWEGLKNV